MRLLNFERSYTTLITGFRKKEGEELEGKDEDEKVRLGDGEDREVQFFLFFLKCEFLKSIFSKPMLLNKKFVFIMIHKIIF